MKRKRENIEESGTATEILSQNQGPEAKKAKRRVHRFSKFRHAIFPRENLKDKAEIDIHSINVCSNEFIFSYADAQEILKRFQVFKKIENDELSVNEIFVKNYKKNWLDLSYYVNRMYVALRHGETSFARAEEYKKILRLFTSTTEEFLSDTADADSDSDSDVVLNSQPVPLIRSLYERKKEYLTEDEQALFDAVVSQVCRWLDKLLKNEDLEDVESTGLRFSQ